jgi:hypothetical protein
MAGRSHLTRESAELFLRYCEEAYAAGDTKPGEHVQGSRRPSAIQSAARRIGIPSGSAMNRYHASVRLAGREPEWKRDAATPSSEAPPAASAPASLVDMTPLAERERVKLQDEITRLRRELRHALRHDLSAEAIRREIFGLAATPPEPPAWLVQPELVKDGPGVPITIWSDWHWNEVVLRQEVGGVNEYNNAVAYARARALVERLISLCFSHRVNPTYPGLVVCLGGDMLSGDIHQELAETNAAPTIASVVDLQNVIAAALETLLERFERILVPCVVGNHGRATHKPRAKSRVHTSYEWLLYQNLAGRFRNDPRITFLIPNETDAHFRVYGHRYLLTHGDSLGVSGGCGIIGTIGPIMRGTFKVSRSEAQIGRDFDTILMGHWHQLLWLRGCIVNGSLKGYDEYARLFLRAPFEAPQQALWWHHPERGIHFRTEIQVESRKFSPAPWIEWRDAA